MARPVVALLTDFGTRDPYVAAMKGVLLSICPDVTLVDLTHDIPPHDVRAGARTLAACCAYYPPGTIFVAVVDETFQWRARSAWVTIPGPWRGLALVMAADMTDSSLDEEVGSFEKARKESACSGSPPTLNGWPLLVR